MSPKRKRRKTDEGAAILGEEELDLDESVDDDLGQQLLRAGKSKDLLIKLLKVCLRTLCRIGNAERAPDTVQLVLLMSSLFGAPKNRR